MSTPLQPGCLKDEAADMATTSRQPKRRKDIVQRYETGGKPTSGEQQNRRKLTVQRGTGETSGAGVNMLCTTCKHLFAYAKDRARRFSWYYDILGLMDSAGKGCHFCVQVLRNIDLADVESLKREFAEPNVEPSKSAEKRLKAETRYYTHMGVAFILRRSGAGQRDYLAHLALYFAQGIKGGPNLNNTNIPSARDQGSLHQIHRWIEQCKAEHVMCKPSMAGSPRGQWPSRLLAVGEHGDTAVKLCETSKVVSSTLHYTTLSHCWGDFVPIRLLTTNISEYLRGIPLDSIPRTFRDAVETTRSLGLSYLWIDSICILQDSAQDWAVESNRMCEIYRNSYLNLAAVASTNATGGLVHSSSLLSRIPCNVMVGRGKYQERALTSYVSGTHRNAKDLPLLSRAWVFQEILLPSRMLLFTRDEVCWECNGMSRTETYPEGEPTHQEGEVKPVDRRVIPFREAWQEISERSSSSRFDLWNRMVSHYSQKKMSKPADKLVAVAGLAHDLGQIWPEAEYLAGIWSFDLVHGLLWHCFGRTRLRFYNAPSWSWASVDGEVDVHSHHDSRFCDKLVEVIEARTFHSSPTMAYGAVTDGYLRLKGPLFQAQIVMEYGNSNTYTIRFLDDSHKGALGSFRVKIDIRVSWDDYGFYEIYHIARPFLVPFEISLKDDATVLIMQGIILSPVRSQKGQYQRIGWFEIEDRPSRPDDYDSESPGGVSSEEDATEMSIAAQADANGLSEKPQLKITDGLDSNASNDGSSPSPLLGNDEEAWRDHCFTVFDLQQLFEEADNEKETLPKFPDLRPLSWMPDEADQSPHEDHLDEHDKFSNGLIDWTLLRRYEDQMDDEDYPNINSFLTFTLMYYEEVILEKKKECDWQYEESHGDGIFTIRVV